MARYYLDKDFVVTGIIPGSMVGIWIQRDTGEPDTDRQVFLGKVDEKELSVPVPNGTHENIFVRIRKPNWRSFETPYGLSGTDGTLAVQQERDYY